jgi:hypothetical protein
MDIFEAINICSSTRHDLHPREAEAWTIVLPNVYWSEWRFGQLAVLLRAIRLCPVSTVQRFISYFYALSTESMLDVAMHSSIHAIPKCELLLAHEPVRQRPKVIYTTLDKHLQCLVYFPEYDKRWQDSEAVCLQTAQYMMERPELGNLHMQRLRKTLQCWRSGYIFATFIAPRAKIVLDILDAALAAKARWKPARAAWIAAAVL